LSEHIGKEFLLLSAIKFCKRSREKGSKNKCVQCYARGMSHILLDTVYLISLRVYIGGTVRITTNKRIIVGILINQIKFLLTVKLKLNSS